MLVAQGERVVALLRPSSRMEHLSGVEVRRAELTAGPALREAVRGAGVVYHCAGCSTDWASEATYQAGNVTATVAMLEAAEGCERFVHVSTTDVYGYPKQPCDENTPPRDVGLPYNRTKIAGEQALWRAAERGLPVTVLRPASIYGPRGSAFITDVVTHLRQGSMLLVDGGRAPGGFIFVDDVCQAMMLAAASPAAAGEVYNLSSTDGADWRSYTLELAAALALRAPWLTLPFAAAYAVAVANELPFRAVHLPGRPLLTRHAVLLLGRDQQFPIAKAQQQLGWSPGTTLADGVARSAEWIRTEAL